MAHKNHTTDLTGLLLKCVAQPDPIHSMLERLCSQLMETRRISSWLLRKVSAQTVTAAIIPGTWIPNWNKANSFILNFL